MPDHKDLTGSDLHEPKAHAHAQYTTGIQYVDVQLTDDQIKALPTTPVELVAAVDGSIVFLHDAYLLLHTLVPYTNLGAQAPGNGITTFYLDSIAPPMYTPFSETYSALSYDVAPDGANAIVRFGAPSHEHYLATDTEVTQGEPRTGASKPSRLGNFSDASPPAGGITLNADNATANYDTELGDFTGGDPANTLSIRCWYSIVPAVPFGGA